MKTASSSTPFPHSSIGWGTTDSPAVTEKAASRNAGDADSQPEADRIDAQERAGRAAMLAGYVAGVLNAAEILDAKASGARGLAGDLLRVAAKSLRESIAGNHASLDNRAMAAVRAFGEVR